MTAYTQYEKEIRTEGVAISHNHRLDRLRDIKLDSFTNCTYCLTVTIRDDRVPVHWILFELVLHLVAEQSVSVAFEAGRPCRHRTVAPPYTRLWARRLCWPRMVGPGTSSRVLPQRAVRKIEPDVRAITEGPGVHPSSSAMLAVLRRRRHCSIGVPAQWAQRFAKRSGPDVWIARHTFLQPPVVAAPSVREPKIRILAGRDQELCDVEDKRWRLRSSTGLNKVMTLGIFVLQYVKVA